MSLDDMESRLKEGKDTVYIVNFWATWCKPCVKELANFDRVARENQDNAVRVLLVSIDDKSTLNTTVKPFVQRQDLQAEVLMLDELKPHVWIDRVDSSWSGAIPATMLVQTSTRRREFFEQEFSYVELNNKLSDFLKGTP
ncbi:MAG: TlpA family protein disulfide reductase [Ignavibacteria bacterium]|nr:TlpA family protein disulfide reductase [Ignavibacteria bacterium]